MPTAYSRSSWSGDEPTDAEWGQVDFETSGEPPNRALATLVEAYRAAFADAVTATFTVRGLTPRLTSWLSENHGDQHPFTGRLLTSSALLTTLPQHDAPPAAQHDPVRPPVFDWMNPRYLAASLADHHVNGGAYDRGPTPIEAKNLADDVAASIIGDHFDHFHIADSNDAWSGFFYDVLPTWVHTWTITNLEHLTTTIITVTDQD